MKIDINIECSTEDEALAVMQRIAGVNGDDGAVEPSPAAKKKVTPKQKAAAVTKTASSPPKKPAKVKAKAGPSSDETKAEILDAAGGNMKDPETAALVKKYIQSFDVAKISDMDEEQLKAAFDGAQDYFGGLEGSEEVEDEDDPMA